MNKLSIYLYIYLSCQRIGKASKRLHILRVLKRSGAHDLLRVHIALIRSVLEYCCPVWQSSLFVQLSERIERVQKRALRIISPASHCEDALKLSGCTTLCARRKLLCAKTLKSSRSPGHDFTILCHRLGRWRMAAPCALTMGHR